MKYCVLHSDRTIYSSVQGHPVCKECYEKRQEERRENKPFKDQLFLQKILRVGYNLEGSKNEARESAK